MVTFELSLEDDEESAREKVEGCSKQREQNIWKSSTMNRILPLGNDEKFCVAEYRDWRMIEPARC